MHTLFNENAAPKKKFIFFFILHTKLSTEALVHMEFFFILFFFIFFYFYFFVNKRKTKPSITKYKYKYIKVLWSIENHKFLFISKVKFIFNTNFYFKFYLIEREKKIKEKLTKLISFCCVYYIVWWG